MTLVNRSQFVPRRGRAPALLADRRINGARNPLALVHRTATAKHSVALAIFFR